MDVSKFLSKSIGLYLIILSIALSTHLAQFTVVINQFLNDVPLMFVTGIFTLVLGILMVVSHNVWEWSWRLIITLLSWMTLLKGLSIFFYPQYLEQMTTAFLQNTSTAYICLGIDFALGVLLCYFGFKR